VNRARGEALETVHHLYVAKLKGHIDEQQYNEYRGRYVQCVRMLNGLERTLEQQLDQGSRRWPNEVQTEPMNPDS
jgi:hypothetical protein